MQAAVASTGDRFDRYIYDGGDIALIFEDKGTVDHLLQGPQGAMALENSAAGTQWLLTDNQGSVRDVTDASGDAIDHLNYDPFGQVISQTNPAGQPLYGFAGMISDLSSTGLYYDNARYYDPATGTFITQDPLSFASGDTNLYRYVGNDPVNNIDPSGLDATSDAAGLSLNTYQNPLGPSPTISDVPLNPNGLSLNAPFDDGNPLTLGHAPRVPVNERGELTHLRALSPTAGRRLSGGRCGRRR